MIADQNFYDICFTFFYLTASATAEGENCAYCPTLNFLVLLPCKIFESRLKYIKKFHYNC